jgi:hypothetical protein
LQRDEAGLFTPSLLGAGVRISLGWCRPSICRQPVRVDKAGDDFDVAENVLIGLISRRLSVCQQLRSVESSELMSAV